MEKVTHVALGTELALHPDAVALAEHDAAVGKTLLAREASAPFASRAVALIACVSEDEWSRYEGLRVPVEASFGLDYAAARALVRQTRARQRRLGLRLWLATAPEGEIVGGIAAFRHPGAEGWAARLQEVDVFPVHRGKGLGSLLLEAVRARLNNEGARVLVVGADEDDWPLAWYRRLGFRDVARVSKHNTV